MTTHTNPTHPLAPDESNDANTFPRDLKGDFRVGDIFVRVSRPASYPGPELYFAVAASRGELDAAPVFDEFDVRFLGSVVNAIHDIVHVSCGTDDVDDEMLSEWFAANHVRWLPAS